MTEELKPGEGVCAECGCIDDVRCFHVIEGGYLCEDCRAENEDAESDDREEEEA